MKDRIRILRKSLRLNQTEFGRRLGLQQGTIAGYETGTRVPSDAAILSICREYGVSELWLRTGEGDMFPPKSRAEELGALVASLLEDRDDSFRSALMTALLRFDPDGPEWSALERIYQNVSALLTGGHDPPK